MAIASEAPKPAFRLSMLIYDTRFRAFTIQIIVLILVLLGVAWLVNNTVQNLAAKGKDIDFSFLGSRAGYDIAQHFIPYTNDSSHFRAAIVGVLNTLVLSFLGCILATVIGVVAGVLRLSSNWLVSRLMTLYVEVFRNVPLLLWIVLTYTLFAETLPSTADFRESARQIAAGEPGGAGMSFGGTVALTNQSLNVPGPYLDANASWFGLLQPVRIGDFSISLNFVLLLVIVLASVYARALVVRAAARRQEETGVRPATWWKSVLILVLPAAIALWAMGLRFEVPEFGRFNFSGGIIIAHSFTALLIALALYTGAYIAEAVRAGILAIARGQSEAAFALGLRPNRTMSLIILPQALRVIIPPLISQYLNLTKNTSLGLAVGYLDLRGTLGGITLNQTGRELECMLLMMLTYLIISLIISSVMNIYNNAVKLRER